MSNLTEQDIPKTISVRTDTQSYSKGYAAAYKNCEQSQETYWGYTAQYWEQLAAGWLPFIVILIAFVLFSRKRRKAYLAKYDHSLETQQKSLITMERTNALLNEISAKLDKK